MGSDACRAALRAYGRGIKRLGVITPYMPAGDRQVRRFFTECGYEIVHLLGLKCGSPTRIAHVSKAELRDAILRVNRGKVDAVVQVGTNLAMAEVAATAEFWLGKPVLAINTATYWYALTRLRHQGPHARLGLAFLRALRTNASSRAGRVLSGARPRPLRLAAAGRAT